MSVSAPAGLLPSRWVAATLIALLAGGCATTPTGSATTVSAPSRAPATSAPTQTLRGVALSPRSFDQEGMDEFLGHARKAGSVLMHAGDWETVGDEQSPFEVVASLGPQLGLRPLIVVSPSSAGRLIRPLDTATKAAYLTELEAFAAAHRPPWLGVGNEVNLVASEDPGAFQAVMDLFVQARARVEAVAPETVVFPVFQYEWLLGRRSGLFGGEDGADQWSLLERLEAEAVGFTTYPFLVFPHPDQLPDDYYTRIRRHTQLPVLFTEVGWPAAEIGGFGGDEAEQAAFVDRFWQLTEPLGPEVAVWPFVYDTGISEDAFQGVGLRRPDGTARPAWDGWTR